MFGRKREGRNSSPDIAELMGLTTSESNVDLSDLTPERKQFVPPVEWREYERELAQLDMKIMNAERKYLALSDEERMRFILLLFLTIIFEGSNQERTIEMPGGEVGPMRKRGNRVREGVKIIPSFSQDPPKVSFTIILRSGAKKYFVANIPQTQEEVPIFINNLSMVTRELVGFLQ